MNIKTNAFHLQPLAFRLKPDTLSYTFHNIRVPDPVKQAVLELQAASKGREIAQTTVPLDNLNLALRALFPDLIAIGKRAWHKGQDYWLLSDQPLHLPTVTLVTRDWILESYKDLPGSRRNDALTAIQNHPFTSRKETIDMAAWGAKNGTAKYDGHEEIYNLLPSFIAAQFSRPETPPFVWGEFHKQFVRVPTTYEAKGAELMSWPPEAHRSKNKEGAERTDYYSVFITFTVQTVPFDPCPVLHCSVGLRHWVSRPLSHLRGGARVYFLAPVPWVQGGLSSGFTIASMRRTTGAKLPDGSKPWKSSWGKNDVLAKLLHNVHLSSPFPSADAIYDNPEAYIKGKNGIYAAMTWATDLTYESGSHHLVEAGLPPLDRFKLWQWLCQTTSSFLEPIAPLPTVRMPVFAPRLINPFFPDEQKGKKDTAKSQSAEEEEEEIETANEAEEMPRVSIAPHLQQERCELLKSAVGEAVEISLHYDSSAIRLGVEAVLQDLFGVAPQKPHYKLPNGVTIYWNPVEKDGPLYTPLFVGDDPGQSCSQGQVRQATEQRRDAIKMKWAAAAYPAVAIVELDNRDKFKQQHTDPKTALRKGLACTNRLSQFLTPPPKDLSPDWIAKAQAPKPKKNPGEWVKPDVAKTISIAFYHRVTNAFLDALRQLGVQTPVTCRATQKPLNGSEPLPCVDYVGYWLAKHTKGGSRTGVAAMLPLFVKVDGTTGEVTARAMLRPKSGGAQKWMPYRDLLLRLGRDEYEPMMPWNDRARFIQYTEDTVRAEFFDGNYLLFTHAQNSRQNGWPYLANTQLQQKRIGFAANLTAEGSERFGGLRILRVRDSDDNETPESFVLKGREAREDLLAPAGGKGIYMNGETAFYIRTGRPLTMRHVNATMSKLTATSGQDGRRTSPQAHKSTPHVRLLEVVPFALQVGDSSFAWAALTLKLCEAATHFGGETLLPLPLHLAKQAQEYLHPLPSGEDDEENDDVD